MRGLPERARTLATGIGTPEPPRHLPKAAKTEWRRVTKACAAYPTWLQATDLPLLESWCTWRAVQLDAIAALAADGVLVPGRGPADRARRADVKHPAISILRAASMELRALSARLGFDPDSRSKIAIGDLEPSAEEHAAARLLS